MISEDQARECAANELRTSLNLEDRLVGKLRGAHPETPVLVRTVSRQPSYWLVPFVAGDRILGFARVLGDSRVAQIGSFADAAEVHHITGIPAREAAGRVGKLIRPELGEVAKEPIFIHDGPLGREAWLVEVTQRDVPTRWIFVTPGFTYERAAGQIREGEAE